MSAPLHTAAVPERKFVTSRYPVRRQRSRLAGITSGVRTRAGARAHGKRRLIPRSREPDISRLIPKGWWPGGGKTAYIAAFKVREHIWRCRLGDWGALHNPGVARRRGIACRREDEGGCDYGRSAVSHFGWWTFFVACHEYPKGEFRYLVNLPIPSRHTRQYYLWASWVVTMVFTSKDMDDT